MIQPIRAKVIQAPRQIKSKYGYCTIIKVKLLKSNKEQVIFGKENDSNVLKRYLDEEVNVYLDAKQKWRLIETDNVRNVNGGGLHHISSTLGSATLRAGDAALRSDEAANIPNKEYSSESNVSQRSESNDDLGDLDLPEPLTPQQKKAIHNLCIERARLLTHCIEVMRNELNHKGLEFHEGSLRSLAVSLFIHISKNLP